eukprot:4803181-Amphidinium_carterae.1
MAGILRRPPSATWNDCTVQCKLDKLYADMWPPSLPSSWQRVLSQRTGSSPNSVHIDPLPPAADVVPGSSL